MLLKPEQGNSIIAVYFDAAGQLLVMYSAFIKYLKKWEYNEALHQLFIDFKRALIKLRWRSCTLLPLSLTSP
jgi:hypothetical protein